MIQCRVRDNVLHVIFPAEENHTQFRHHLMNPEVYKNPERCRDVLRASERYEGKNNNFIGFNFPSSIVTREETTLFPYVALFSVQYVVAYMEDDEATISHELRHARFHMDEAYRYRVNRTWVVLRQKRPDVYRSIVRRLKTIGYENHVFVDEFQAYFPDLIM